MTLVLPETCSELFCPTSPAVLSFKAAAEAGMADMSETFKQKGGEIYLKSEAAD